MGENVLKLGTDSLGGYLSDPTFIRGLEQLIQPQTLFLQLCRNIPMSRTTVYLPPMVSTGPSLSWLGEGDRKAVSDVAFSRQTMTARKVAVITPWTDELDAESFVSMRGAIQRAVSDAAATEVDYRLWTGDTATDTPDEPEGLLTQAASFLSVTYGAQSDLGLDFKAMLRAMRVADTEPSSYVCHPTVLDKLQGIETSDGLPKYASTLAPQPSIWGKTIHTTSNLPSTGPGTDDEYVSSVVLAKWSDVWVGRMPGSVALLDQATLVKSDSTEIHLAQEDKRALRYVARISSPVVRRTNSVCIMESVIA